MAKKNNGKHHHKKDDKNNKKHAKKHAAPLTATAAETPADTPERYADGKALDQITYLEAKLILKPDRFTSVQTFHDFGKLVKQTAKAVGVGYLPDPHTDLRPDVREIIFLDTPDFRLYNNAFILRRRVSYVDGFPIGDAEIVFKYRHPDQHLASALDVRPNIAGKYEIKFKEEVLPLKQEVGGYRTLYSHNCQFGFSQMHDADKTSMTTLAKVFPGLSSLKKSDEERVNLVNGGIVEEILLPLGQLDFGKGMLAKADISLWRTRGEHFPLVGEFAFQMKFPDGPAGTEKARKLALQFYVSLQNTVGSWLALGVTKTAMVYRLNGNQPQSHE